MDSVASAYATESALLLRVSRLLAEQLVCAWMRDWKQFIGSQSVTVTIRWGDILSRAEQN